MIARIFGDDEKGGGVNRGDRHAIHALILAMQPERMLEVGTHIGASTCTSLEHWRAASIAATW